jgi:rare lipoprotein A
VISARIVLLFTIIAFALCAAVPALGAERVRASYYGSESSNRTASGERFRPNGLTAAHRTLPFGTRLRVCLAGRCVVVRISDRGPARWTGRSLDLSKGAARVIGMLRVGVASVEVERVR